MKWQSIHKPKLIVHDKSVSTPTYGRFYVEPLDKGFGNTLGNALRRVILSSMQGAAITSFRIEGILHEFSTIPGIVEDVTEIVLNLKGVRLRVNRDFPVPLYIDVDKKGPVTAADIQGDPSTDVINPDHVLFNIAKKQRVLVDLEIGAGKGFVVASENKVENAPVDTIFIDSIFTPVKKVNYTVEDARVGQRTDFDKLILEIETDGSITPEEAITMGSRILMEHLELFIIPEAEMEQVQEEKVDEALVRIKNLLRLSVAELELSVRASNCLNAANILTMADLVQRTEHEMLKYRNFGRKSLEELGKVLEELNLSFGMDVSQYFNSEELDEIRELAKIRAQELEQKNISASIEGEAGEEDGTETDADIEIKKNEDTNAGSEEDYSDYDDVNDADSSDADESE